MSSFKLATAILALLSAAAPVAVAGDGDTTRQDPYAGYRMRYTSTAAPRHVEHRPRIIRTQPLIRPHKTYINASGAAPTVAAASSLAPAPVEVRVRTAASPAGDSLAGRTSVVVSQPAVRIDRNRYEDIGVARVVRNPLLRHDPPVWRDQVIEPATAIEYRSYPTWHRTSPRPIIRIVTPRYDCYPRIDHRSIYRRYHGHHGGWRHHRSHRWGGFIRYSYPARSHCGPSTGFSVYLRF